MISQQTKKTINFFLIAILLLAIIVRVRGIGFGLPNTQCRPDETISTNIIHSVFLKFHPGSFNWPSLYKYLILGLYFIYYGLSFLLGRYESFNDFGAAYLLEPTYFYIIARLLSVFFGVFTVYMLYKLAFSFSKNNYTVSLLSALFLGTAYLHVRDSHFATPDVTATFFIVCSVYFIIGSYHSQSIKSYCLAGVFAGLAASAKYIGFFLILPAFLAFGLKFFNRQGDWSRFEVNKLILVFILALGISFFVASPYVLLDYKGFEKDVFYELNHLNLGHQGLGEKDWLYHLKFSLFFGLGGTLFLSSLLGIITIIKHDFKKALIVLSFLATYYFVCARSKTVFLRYIIPLLPFLCLSAAFFVNSILKLIADRFPGKKSFFIKVIIVSVVLFPSALSIIKFDSLLAKPDSRLIAKRWIDENLTDGSTVYQTFLNPYGKINIGHSFDFLETVYAKLKTENSNNHFLAKALKKEMASLREKGLAGFKEWNYDNQKGMFFDFAGYKDSLPDFIIVESYPLEAYSNVFSRIVSVLSDQYRLLKSFEVIDVKNKSNKFDRQDAFFIPFTGFKSISHSGPNIYVYQLKDRINIQSELRKGVFDE
ncbi:MAG: phospholipid carrier-dependent glycosyltransferase [Candidatus Omnitrophica bacterium]|nr:phospholipid carrier-dependent glycosyltransferase [Candidatus Omnitrophota bacterium]